MRREEYIELANRYEVSSFIATDPVRYPRMFINKGIDQEIAAVIAAWLAYGQRKVFMPKIKFLLEEEMGWSPTAYILTRSGEKHIDNHQSLYRMTSWHNFGMLCRRLYEVYDKYETLQEAVITNFYKRKYGYYYQGLCHVLTGETMIPSPMSNSANKRVNMLMRWMVRQNSPVDIGLWTNIPSSKLLVPCDTHSIAKAIEFDIIHYYTENKRTCIKLTNFAKDIFPDDPARLDFALYGDALNQSQNDGAEK